MHRLVSKEGVDAFLFCGLKNKPLKVKAEGAKVKGRQERERTPWTPLKVKGEGLKVKGRQERERTPWTPLKVKGEGWKVKGRQPRACSLERPKDIERPKGKLNVRSTNWTYNKAKSQSKIQISKLAKRINFFN